MSNREQVLKLVGNRGEVSVSELSEHVECSQGGLYALLSKMASEGEIERVRPGVYAKPGRKPRAEKPAAVAAPAPEPAAAEVQPPAADSPDGDQVVDEAPELLIGIWSDQSVALSRGEERMDFTVVEVQKILRFLNRAGVALVEAS